MIGQLTYSQSLEPLNSKFTGTKIQYSERNFEYSWSIFDYSESIAANTFPANRYSPPSCRLDTSLLSAGQQGAERRSASKVTKLITLGNVHSRQLLTAIRVEVVEVKSYTGDEKIPKYLVKRCR